MARTRRTKRQKLMQLRKALRQIVGYPTGGHCRRTEDGYPVEVDYDEFAYKRMVDSFRDAITRALDESSAPW